jgi:predicted O-linked N-acetylglucosamine transferase (SPINDLY family)
MAVDPQRMEQGRHFHRAGDFARAEPVFREIVAADPANGDAWHLLGRACLGLGKLGDAEACYLRAGRLRPDSAEVQNNLGVVYVEQGQLEQALARFNEAIRLAPHIASGHNNRGLVLERLRKFEEAAANFREALRLQADFADAHFNLGNVLRREGRCDEAVVCYREALRLKPDYGHAHNNLGNAFKDQGMLDEALACFRAAVAADPSEVARHSNLLLSLHYHPAYDRETLFAEHRRWAEEHAGPLAPHAPRHAVDPNPGRLRIGYVSPDFRAHAVAFFLEPILAAHDRTQFEIVCYSEVPRPDQMTQRLQRYAERWRPTPGLSDEQVAEMIRQDGIHILVDLAGHTASHRLKVFARKPAPIQVSYLGYIATTGLTTIDYRITDAQVDPPGQTERFHTEQLLRLPEIVWCYRPPDGVNLTPLPAGAKGSVTFGSLHNLAKVTPQVIALWARVLNAVPDARMLLVTGVGPDADRRLLKLFHEHGVPADRLILVGRTHYRDYLRLYHRIDIVLDTFPFSGLTTSCEALWMSVPVVTLAGNSYVSRQGVSLLSHLGLPDLIAEDPDAYVQIAVRLANDRSRLLDLRSSLRERMKQATLTNGPRFTRGLEEIYRTIWERFRHEKAHECLVRTIPPSSLTEDLARARQLHQAGDVPRAMDVYRQILRGDASQAQVWYLLGAACQTLGRLDEAVNSLREAIRLRPNHAASHNHLGVALGQQGNLDEATTCFRQALRLNPTDREARANLERALLKRGKQSTADQASSS